MQIFWQKNALYPSFFLKNTVIEPFLALITVQNSVTYERDERADHYAAEHVQRKVLAKINTTVSTECAAMKSNNWTA